MSTSQSTPAPIPAGPAWVRQVQRITTYMTEDVGGGPRPLKMAWAVNTHKVITAFIILAMMVHFDNFSVGAWVYLALHGTYGYCWLIKDATCRDANFDRRITLGATAVLYLGLIAWYWVLPYLFISRHIEPGYPLLAACIAVHTFGVVLMVAADLQKNFILKLRKGLISGGVFAYTRNPNYLGEILIYGTYAVLAAHWLGWAVVLWCWLGLFLPRMLAKDVSLSRHPGWAQYKARSGLLLPSWRLLQAPFKASTEEGKAC
ncbi:MAG: methyltransferase family protein [Pseudomonas sp.]